MVRQLQKLMGLLVIAFASLFFGSAACFAPKELEVEIDTAGSSGFLVTVEAMDLEIMDPDTYASKIDEIRAHAEENDMPLRFVPKGQVAKDLTHVYGDGTSFKAQSTNGGSPSMEPQVQITIGSYVITVDCTPENKSAKIWGCINRKVGHCNVRVNTEAGKKGGGKYQLFDLHVAGFRDDEDRYCLGFYQSVQRSQDQEPLNYCPCWPNGGDFSKAYWAIRNNIFDAFVLAGITTGTAGFLAAILTPVVVAPGVLVLP